MPSPAVTACAFIKEKVSYDSTKTTIEAEYLVSTDGYVSPAAIKDMTFSGKPSGADTHTVVTNAFITAITCDYREGTGINNTGPYQYDYNVTFETPTPSTPAGPEADPEDEPPDISWGGADSTETMYFDMSDPPVPIENYAHQAYENQPTREAGQATVNITRKEASNNASLWNQYSFSINSDTWHGNDPFVCKMGRITASKKWRNGTSFWLVTYPITFKEQGWRLTLNNVGTSYLDAAGKLQEVIDSRGGAPGPVPLNEDGSVRDPGETPRVLTNTYKRYIEATWATLDLPTPF